MANKKKRKPTSNQKLQFGGSRDSVSASLSPAQAASFGQLNVPKAANGKAQEAAYRRSLRRWLNDSRQAEETWKRVIYGY